MTQSRQVGQRSEIRIFSIRNVSCLQFSVFKSSFGYSTLLQRHSASTFKQPEQQSSPAKSANRQNLQRHARAPAFTSTMSRSSGI
jgi:hypothetical protein